MGPQDRSDDAVAEPLLYPAEPAEQLMDPDENGHVEGEPAVVPLPDAPALSAELALRLTAVEAGLAEVAQQFAGESARALARERVIDRQHEEIERLKVIERGGQLRPIVTDLCRLRNGLLRQAGTVPEEITGPQVASLLVSFAATVEEILERCGVVVLPRDVGAPFASSRQEVAGVVEINHPERDGTVADVVQDGYAAIHDGRTVVPARVRVHRYMTKEKTDG
ncbi:MAG: nucleotide exchange factor GrpE [Pseudonocardiaceae bacterium]